MIIVYPVRIKTLQKQHLEKINYIWKVEKSLQTWSKSVKIAQTLLKAIDRKYIYGRVKLSCKENVWWPLNNAQHVLKLILLDGNRAAGAPVYCPIDEKDTMTILSS